MTSNMRYLVYLIEHKKRTYLCKFENYDKAAEYCKKGKEDDPSVWFLIDAISSQGIKMFGREKTTW